MVQKGLDFDLPKDIVDFKFGQLCLLDYLEDADEIQNLFES
jgi:hypothetical protein